MFHSLISFKSEQVRSLVVCYNDVNKENVYLLTRRLSVGKQRKVYVPDDPFPHAELVKNNRLRHFKTLNEISDLRQPCILFCGHPSLRFGDIVHVVESWGSNSANTIIFTGKRSIIGQTRFEFPVIK